MVELYAFITALRAANGEIAMSASEGMTSRATGNGSHQNARAGDKYPCHPQNAEGAGGLSAQYLAGSGNLRPPTPVVIGPAVPRACQAPLVI